jgi:hypothetical protein
MTNFFQLKKATTSKNNNFEIKSIWAKFKVYIIYLL